MVIVFTAVFVVFSIMMIILYAAGYRKKTSCCCSKKSNLNINDKESIDLHRCGNNFSGME